MKDLFKRRLLQLFVLCLAVAFGYGALKHLAPTHDTRTARNQPRVPPRAPSAATLAARPAASLLTFSPSEGTILNYRFEIGSHSDLDVTHLLRVAGAISQAAAATPKERQKVAVDAKGTLSLRFFERHASDWNVGARITELDYVIGSQSAPESQAMLQPFTFTFRSDGSLEDFQFSPGVTPKAQAALRQILSWFQVILPKEAKANWSAREQDATGSYRSSYSLKSVTGGVAIVTKRKLDYSEVVFALTPTSHDVFAEVVKSNCEYRLSSVGPWLTSGTLSEELVLRTKDKPWGHVTSRGTIQLIDSPDAAKWPNSFAEFRARVDSTGFLASKYYATDPILDALWANLTLAAALDRFMEMLTTDRKLAEALMVNFLRQQPSRSFELVGMLDDSTRHTTAIDESTRLTLWRLNATAGHKQAQQAQLQAALSPASTRKTRMNALAHLDFENPEPFVIERVLQFRRSALNTSSPTERELADMALLSLGALGDAEHPNKATSARIEHELTRQLESSKAPSETIVALQAIGNSGNSAAIDAVSPYLRAADDAIRVNALESLRRMDDPRASTILMQSFEQDTNAAMRSAALRALASMPPTDQTMAWGRSALTSGLSTPNQAQLAAWLGSQAERFPENEQELRRLLAANPPFEVKKSILKYIAP